jgi:hypothetical protein
MSWHTIASGRAVIHCRRTGNMDGFLYASGYCRCKYRGGVCGIVYRYVSERLYVSARCSDAFHMSGNRGTFVGDGPIHTMLYWMLLVVLIVYFLILASNHHKH